MWSHLPEKKLCLLQKIQDRAFYLIECAPIKGQIQPARLNVENIITYDRAIMVRKILKEMCPENVQRKFTRRNHISKYQIPNDLHISKTLLEILKKCFSYVGAMVWNDMPNDIRNIESTHLILEVLYI